MLWPLSGLGKAEQWCGSCSHLVAHRSLFTVHRSSRAEQSSAERSACAYVLLVREVLLADGEEVAVAALRGPHTQHHLREQRLHADTNLYIANVLVHNVLYACLIGDSPTEHGTSGVCIAARCVIRELSKWIYERAANICNVVNLCIITSLHICVCVCLLLANRAQHTRYNTLAVAEHSDFSRRSRSPRAERRASDNAS